MRFHREAFLALLERSEFNSPADFAKSVDMSPGALHDITALNPDTQRPRRQPSDALIRKLASGLKVPLVAIIRDPASERVAS